MSRAGLVPTLGWIRTYDRSWLRGDLIAGVTVAALIVPKNLGYAGIAGIPLQNGLYAAAAGAHPVRDLRHQPADLDGAELGAGRRGRQRRARRRASPTSATSRRSSRASRWPPGCCSCSSPCCKMGWIAQFLSRAVVTGFLFGAAIDVVIGELPKLTGTDVSGTNSFQELWSWLGTLGETQRRDRGRGRRLAGRRVRAATDRAPGARARWSWSSAGCSPPGCSTSGARGVALVGDVPRGLPVVRGSRPRR